jgi:hypothetical protein
MIHVRFVFLVCATGLFPAAFHPIRRRSTGILTLFAASLDSREMNASGSARVSRAGFGVTLKRTFLAA